MMKYASFCLFVFLGTALPSFAQKTYKSAKTTLGFYSHTPIEDIQAVSEKGVSVLNTAVNQVAFTVYNTSFQFSNSLMQEHFNEKYMESDKYPKSSFSGKINESVDWGKEGSVAVTVTGKLTVHGVSKDRTIPVTLSLKEGKIQAKSEFTVKTADHKIEIPQLVWEKIAEEIKINVIVDYVSQ